MHKLAKADLARSNIDSRDAETAGIYYEPDASTVYRDFQPLPALVIPYYDPWEDDCFKFERKGREKPFCRVRYLKMPPPPRGFKRRKPQRYGQPKASGVHPYLPLVEHFDWLDVAEDPEIPLVITEGEKKALRGCLAGFPTIGLGGVYNFMADGELLPILNRFVWKGRKVFLCYDSDAAENPLIQAAEGRLAGELSTKRRANVFLTRLPPTESGEKQGIDDYILSNGGGEIGEKAWRLALEDSEQINKADAKILEMNRQICIIDADEALYQFRTEKFMSKQHFKDGSRFATDFFTVPAQKGTGTKKVFLAPLYLKHPLALRYDDVIFDPSTEEAVVTVEGKICLNTWKGLEGVPGDPTPFLELTAHLSEGLMQENQDFLLKLMAYRFQNPGVKIPLAVVLVGDSGSGKSMWSKIVAEACAPYSYPMKNADLESDFNAWIEKSLIAVLDEAQGKIVRERRDYLKTLISEARLSLNDKYRKTRPVATPTMYILTSNDFSSASYDHDDRRMFIVDVQGKLPKQWYLDTLDWIEAGGPKHVLYYLQNYDLKGWRPPNEAPLTSAKVQAYEENLTLAQRTAEQMKTADQNIVEVWCDAAWTWAQEHLGSSVPAVVQQAQETQIALRNMPIRPIYTADELAMILPHLTYTLSGQKLANTAAGALSRELRSAGIRYLTPRDDPRGFFYRGQYRQFLVIANIKEVPRSLSQNEFDRLVAGAPKYGELRKLR